MKCVRTVSIAFALIAVCARTLAAEQTRPSAKAPGAVPGPPGSKLVVPKVIGLVGQTITLEAVLTRAEGGTPLEGRRVAFRVRGTPGGDVAAGEGATDASGRVRVPFKVPELKQAAYVLTALFSGELPAAGPASGAGQVTVFKAETKLRLDEVTPTGGPHGYGNPEARRRPWVRISLTRKPDGEAVKGRKVRLTVDGRPFGDHDSTGNVVLPALPDVPALLAAPWTVEARFEGDECYQSTEPARLVVKKNP